MHAFRNNQFYLKSNEQKIDAPGAGGNSLIKVYVDVQQVQNLSGGKCFQKYPIPMQKLTKNAMTRQVFMNFKVQKSELSVSRSLFIHSLIKFYALLFKTSPKA